MRQPIVQSSVKHAKTDRGRRAGPSFRLVAALAAAVATGAASGAVYKWTDASGRVVYSDQPPPGNVKVETLKAPPPPANPDAAKELAKQSADLRKRDAERAEAQKKLEKANADEALQRAQCAQTRANIAELSAAQTMRLVYRVNERGERVILDDAARRAEVEQLQAWLRENCGE